MKNITKIANYIKASIPPNFSFEDTDGEKHYRREYLNDEDYNEVKKIVKDYSGTKQIDMINKFYKDKGYRVVNNRF